jgi:hypothetical protein
MPLLWRVVHNVPGVFTAANAVEVLSFAAEEWRS